MTKPITYPRPPVELPLDSWLYETGARQDCGVCRALVEEVRGALDRGDQGAAFAASQEVRNHPVHDRHAVDVPR
ncbi:hypothetical protein [Streptomyces xanthochromogenes]|uniref:hypothetical protein n=1 Tax=Streptomyces xanthochromogenes TaxID=67384 RepID=UPI00378841A4